MQINRTEAEIRARLLEEMAADRRTWGREPAKFVDGRRNPDWVEMVQRRRRIETLRRALTDVSERRPRSRR